MFWLVFPVLNVLQNIIIMVCYYIPWKNLLFAYLQTIIYIPLEYYLYIFKFLFISRLLFIYFKTIIYVSQAYYLCISRLFCISGLLFVYLEIITCIPRLFCIYLEVIVCVCIYIYISSVQWHKSLFVLR